MAFFRRLQLSSVSITCFTFALADSMDDDSTVIDRAMWIRKLGSIARQRNRDIPVKVQQQRTGEQHANHDGHAPC